MNKALLVAQREYLGSVRTRSFWLQLLAFPTFIAAIMAVGIFMARRPPEVRTYAVIDHSGWVLPAIEARAATRDVLRVLNLTIRRQEAGGQGFERLPLALRQAAPSLAALDAGQLRALAAWIAAAPAGAPATQGDAAVPAALAASSGDLRSWWQGLSPAAARALDDDLSKGRYIPAPVPEGAADPAALNALVVDGDLSAYFVIAADPVGAVGQDPTGASTYVSRGRGGRDVKEWFGDHASAVVRARRIATAGIDPLVAQQLQQSANFNSYKASASGTEEVGPEDFIRQFAPAAFAYVLIMGIFFGAYGLLTSTTQEKSSRIIEVLLSSITPLQLMSGKIVGLAAVGLTVLGMAAVSAYVAVKLLPNFIDGMPDVTEWITIDIGFFGLYFLLGYLFYAAILVAIGAIARSAKEAEGMVVPVMFAMFLPLATIFPVAQDPNGTLARVLSYIPPLTPYVMMNRAAGPPSVLDFVLTTALLGVAIVAVFWAAARIFRVGILMTGQRPSVREVVRWLWGRQPAAGRLPEAET